MTFLNHSMKMVTKKHEIILKTHIYQKVELSVESENIQMIFVFIASER